MILSGRPSEDAASSLETAKLLQRLRGFKSEQKFAQLVCHGGRHALDAAILPELPQPFVTKADKLHLSSCLTVSSWCTVLPYMSSQAFAERVDKILEVSGAKT
jgi:hypothetical protein